MGLGVTPDVGNHALKIHYRKLVVDNHPDKMIARGVPPELRSYATKKIAAINAAYEAVAESAASNPATGPSNFFQSWCPYFLFTKLWSAEVLRQWPSLNRSPASMDPRRSRAKTQREPKKIGRRSNNFSRNSPLEIHAN